MPDKFETKSGDALTGAIYFVVGRGTEGGPASYRLSVAGVTSANWGRAEKVADNSGYSIGTIQVDLAQRGAWPLGEIGSRKLESGEKTYVDAIIEQASSFAKSQKIAFTDDLVQLRKDLLSHGNGQQKRTTISFIDRDTRDGINAWAASDDGKRWIYQNVDLPQARNIADLAVSILDRSGANISEKHRFAAACILAKTANQLPAKLVALEEVLKGGGNYDDLLSEAKEIKTHRSFFDAPKAAKIAVDYEREYASPGKQRSLDEANLKVSSKDFDPSNEATDVDISLALTAIGTSRKAGAVATADGVLQQGEHGPDVKRLQEALNEHGAQLPTTGRFGPQTKAALIAFQDENGLTPDGKAGKATLSALGLNVQDQPMPPLPGVAPAQGVPGAGMGGSVLELERWGAFRPQVMPDSATGDAALRPSSGTDNERGSSQERFNLQQQREQPFFVQAMRGLDRLGPEAGGYRNQDEKERIAGALAVKAGEYTPPMKEITDVVASKVNGNLFAVWVNPGNHLDVIRAHVDKAQAVDQPLAASLATLQAVTQQNEIQRQPSVSPVTDEPARAVPTR